MPSAGGFYYTGGVKGIIFYHQGVDVYLAYERNCPYNPADSKSIVYVDSTNVTVLIQAAVPSSWCMMAPSLRALQAIT